MKQRRFGEDAYRAWDLQIQRLPLGHLVGRPGPKAQLLREELVHAAQTFTIEQSVRSLFQGRPAHRTLDATSEAARWFDLLDEKFGLAKRGVLAKIDRCGYTPLVECLHVALRHEIQIVVNTGHFASASQDQRDDLASAIHLEHVVQKRTYLERWNPEQGGIQKFLRVHIRPGGIEQETFRAHGLFRFLRSAQKGVREVGLDVVPDGEAGSDEFGNVHAEDYYASLRAGVGIDATITMQLDGFTEEEIAQELGMNVKAVQRRRRKEQARLRHLRDIQKRKQMQNPTDMDETNFL